MHLLISVYAPYTLTTSSPGLFPGDEVDTLNELFHSALPWECEVYVPSTRLRFNEQYCYRRGYNLSLLYQGIQRVQPITHTDVLTQRTIADSLTRIPLVLGYHRAIRSISSIFHKHIHIIFSHPPNLVLLCLDMYLSLPSYVPTRRKSAICGLPVRNQSSRLMLWRYTPLFTKSSSRRATGGYIDGVKLELLRGRGMVWEPWGPPPWYIWNQFQTDCQWTWALDFDDLSRK